MKNDILHFFTKFLVFQCNKGQTIKSPVTLQLLPIPSIIWIEISMDFIVGLPKSINKCIIMVVVYLLSKHAHFCALPRPFTPTLVAQVFLDHIFKLHGMLPSIVSDHDLNLTSTFWKEFFKFQRTQLIMSTTYHPQYDGQNLSGNFFFGNLLEVFCFGQTSPLGVMAPLVKMMVQYFLSYNH
jgi:hypothetical protein